LPRFCSVDNFSDCFSFYTVNYKDTEVKNAHLHTLDKIFKDSLSNPNTVLVISNTSIKNNVVTLISYICSGQNILAKTIHHTINITSTKMKLFSIRYRINKFKHQKYEYCLRFFPRELFDCSCGIYLIKSRYHILHKCRRYNKY